MFIKRLKSELFPIVIILIIPLVIIDGALLHNKALVPSDLLSAYPAWQEAFASTEVSNALLSDDVLQFYPWRKLAYEEARASGNYPLWNPYELTGQPLVANAQSALYFPPNLLLHWVEPATMAAISAYFDLVMIGIFTFYFCRALKLGKTASLFAGTSAMLSLPAIVYVGNPLVNSMSSFPLMLLAGEKIINTHKPFPWIAALGIGIGISLLGGHPETSFHICVGFGIYFLARLIIVKPGLRRAGACLGVVLLGVVIGLLIGAIQWLPFMDFLFHSATLAGGGRSMGGTQVFYSSDWLYNLTGIFTYVIPNFFGSPLTNNYTWPFPNYQNYNEQAVYFGLIPLGLSLFALFHRPRRPQVLILAGISLFFLAVAWRLPLFEAVNHIPPFSLLLNKRLKLFIPLMMAVVAGVGLDGWSNPGSAGDVNWKQRIPALLPPVFSLGVFAIIGLFNLFTSTYDFLKGKPHDFVNHLVLKVFNLNQPLIMVSFAMAVIFILLSMLAWRRAIMPAFFGYSVVTVTIVELLVLGWNYNPVADRNLIYPEIPLVSLLKQETQPFRTLSTDLVLFPPDAGAAYRIAQIEGYDLPIYSSIYDIYRAQGGDQPSHRQVWSIDFPLVDWLNIRYVITSSPIQKDGFTLLLDQESYQVYRNEYAYPRATLVYNYEVIEDRAKLLEAMVSNPEILNNKALFNEQPAIIGAADQLSPPDSTARVEFLSYGMDRSVISIESDQPGFLVVSDLYTRDWKARLDGKEVPLLNANYAFRAVSIPAGQHQVEFYYQPLSFSIGLALSGLGLFVLFALFISPILIPEKRRGGVVNDIPQD